MATQPAESDQSINKYIDTPEAKTASGHIGSFDVLVREVVVLPEELVASVGRAFRSPESRRVSVVHPPFRRASAFSAGNGTASVFGPSSVRTVHLVHLAKDSVREPDRATTLTRLMCFPS